MNDTKPELLSVLKAQSEAMLKMNEAIELLNIRVDSQQQEINELTNKAQLPK